MISIPEVEIEGWKLKVKKTLHRNEGTPKFKN